MHAHSTRLSKASNYRLRLRANVVECKQNECCHFFFLFLPDVFTLSSTCTANSSSQYARERTGAENGTEHYSFTCQNSSGNVLKLPTKSECLFKKWVHSFYGLTLSVAMFFVCLYVFLLIFTICTNFRIRRKTVFVPLARVTEL